MVLTGRSERTARAIIEKIKKETNKLPHQMVTVEECCHYLGITPEKINLL